MAKAIKGGLSGSSLVSIILLSPPLTASMPPKRKAPAAATAARPVRARKSNTEPVPSAPTLAVAPQPLPRFIHLPTKVLDRIKTHVQAPSDVLSLAQTCQAFWKKWGRPDDWPKQHFYSDHQGPVLFSRHGYVPLFYLAGAKPGEPGHSPFYIQGLEFQGDDGFSLVAAQIGLHHLGPNAELDYGRWEREVREDDWGNDGGLGPERCWDLDWFQNRHKMMTATPAWIHKHFPCQTCNGTFVVRNGDAQLEAESVRFQATLALLAACAFKLITALHGTGSRSSRASAKTATSCSSARGACAATRTARGPTSRMRFTAGCTGSTPSPARTGAGRMSTAVGMATARTRTTRRTTVGTTIMTATVTTAGGDAPAGLSVRPSGLLVTDRQFRNFVYGSSSVHLCKEKG